MPCGVNATCLIDKNEVFCQCYENMIGDPIKKCWEIGEDICEPNPCGENSKCIKNPKPGCLCLPGFFGQPPNCREGCESDSKCAENEFCDYDRLCKVGCRSDDNCELDEFCDIDGTRKCKKGCRSEENCGQNEICEIFTKTCVPGCLLNKHCKDGEYCEHSINRCINPCSEEPSPCGQNSICKSSGHSRNVKCSCERGFMPKSGVGCVKKLNSTRISSKNLDCKKYCAKYAECELVSGKIECQCPDEIFREIFNPFKECLPSPPRPQSGFSPCTQAIKPECAVPLSPATIAVLAG